MAIVKVRSFSRGYSAADMQAIAGTTNACTTTNATTQRTQFVIGRGARWDVVNGRTLMRTLTSNVVSAFPGHASNPGICSWIEDLGAASDYYAKGGFCFTAYGKYYNSADGGGYLFSPDGTTIRSVVSFSLTSTGTNFFDFTPRVSVPGSGSFSSLASSTWLHVASTGELLIANGTNYGWWDSAMNPTTSGAITSTNEGYASPVYHAGNYYVCRWNTASTSNPRVMRMSGAWNASQVAVYTPNASNPGAPVRLQWFDNPGCFIYVGTANSNSQVQIGRSPDGTTWTTVSNGQTTGTPRDVAADPTTGNMVMVGNTGLIMSSVDGGVTWAVRTSGTTDHITAVIWFNGEFIGMTSTGNAVTSSDTLTWTLTQNRNSDSGLTSATNIAWRFFVMNSQLYCTRFYQNNNLAFVVMRYIGKGQWDCIFNVGPAAPTATAGLNPLGVFFADPYSGSGLMTGGNNMQGANMTTTGLWTYYSPPQNATWVNGTQATTATDSDWHKIQVVATAIPGQSLPTFSSTIWIDNIQYGSATTITAASATQRLWFCTASGGFNMVSDVLVTDFSGTSNVGQVLGDIQIRPRASVDQDATAPQWDKVPASVSTNALAAVGNGSAVSATSSVQSSSVGNTDTYQGGSVSAVSGYRIAAVSTSATFQRLGVPTPTVSLGLIDSGTTMTAGNTTLSGSTAVWNAVTVVNETNSSGIAWTPARVAAAQIQLKRTA